MTDILREPVQIQAAGVRTAALRIGLRHHRLNQIGQHRRVAEGRGACFEFAAHQYIADGAWVEYRLEFEGVALGAHLD